jgi:hypothetical protein
MASLMASAFASPGSSFASARRQRASRRLLLEAKLLSHGVLRPLPDSDASHVPALGGALSMRRVFRL